MSKMRLVVLWSTLLFALAAIGLALSAAGQAAAPLATPAGAAPLPPPDGEGPWVVRAYFTDREMVALLASRIEPWEVHYDKGFLVVEVDRSSYYWLQQIGFTLEVDQARTEELHRVPQPLPGQVTGIPGYPCYRTVEETYSSAQSIAAANPTLATWSAVGSSWEKTKPGGLPGYDLKVLRLTNSALPGPKPKLFIMSAIHAREYATAELTTRFAEYLVAQYGLDADVTWLLDYHEIHFLLQSNPDGRKMAEAGDLWRKNTDNDDGCTDPNSWGTDLNRNFAFQWACCGGSSGAPCDETYRGPASASEPEVQVVQNYVKSQFPDQRADPLTSPAPANATGVFLDIHSYSELVLWPWGFTSTPAPNSAALQTLGRRFAYFNNYWPEQAIGLYPTDGTTDDFAYGDLGLAAYTFEIGTSFFQDCSTFENTIYPDNLPSLLYAAKAARTPYLTPSGPDALAVQPLPAAVSSGDLVQVTATINDTRFNNSNGVEPTQNINAAEYYLDVPPWITTTLPVAYPMSPADGSFDSKIENVTASLDTSGLSQGRHILFVRGRDANGQWGPVSAAFIYILDPAAAPRIEGYVRELGSNLPLSATLTTGPFQTASNPMTGYYSMMVISGTHDLSAVAPSHAISTVLDLSVQDYQTFQQDFYLSPVCSAFSDDVESGDAGWTASTPWAITTSNAHSPSHAWTDSPSGSYGNNLNISLTSPLLDLSDYSSIALSFWHSYATESGWDYVRVEYSTNGGTSWNSLQVYSGSSGGWREETFSIPALDGLANARIRFRFTTDSNTVNDGWYLDDIVISGSGAACAPATPPTSDFTSNSPVVLGEAVHFSNLTSGSQPLTFAWDFGDGAGASTLSDPSYTYSATGTFTVTLTASNTLGLDSVSHPVVVGPCIPIQAVTLTQISADPLYLGDLVSYQADIFPNDAHKPYTYTIDFADGGLPVTLSSSLDPLLLTHAFSSLGDHAVTFSAWNCAMPAPQASAATTTIEPRHGMTVTPSPSQESGRPGSVVTHTLRLTNIGDEADTFTLALSIPLWYSSLSTTQVILPPGAAAEFDVQVSVPISAPLGASDAVSLTVTSLFPAAPPVRVELISSVAPVYAFSASAPLAAQFGYPGDVVTYTLQLENTGNAADTYSAQVTGGWPASLSATQLAAPPGGAAALTVNFAIPAAAGGQSSMANVVLTSQNDPAQTQTIQLITTAGWRLYFAVIMR
ncbi:MAG: PKD domain-containing protein [Chloroflexi bacterium]|nr:PKD domain-containing protein [Chloroflexota bacterium]